MPRKKSGVKCSICGREFALPLHLGRHMTSMHGKKSRKAKKAKMKRGPRGRRRIGRPPGVASKFGLSSLSVNELMSLISAAKDEGRSRIQELESAIQ